MQAQTSSCTNNSILLADSRGWHSIDNLGQVNLATMDTIHKRFDILMSIREEFFQDEMTKLPIDDESKANLRSIGIETVDHLSQLWCEVDRIYLVTGITHTFLKTRAHPTDLAHAAIFNVNESRKSTEKFIEDRQHGLPTSDLALLGSKVNVLKSLCSALLMFEEIPGRIKLIPENHIFIARNEQMLEKIGDIVKAALGPTNYEIVFNDACKVAIACGVPARQLYGTFAVNEALDVADL